MPGSILVVTFDTATGVRTGKLVSSTLLEDNAVVSGKLGSGIIGPIHFVPFSSGMVVVGQDAGVTPVYDYPPAGVPGDESITSAKLASGAVGGDRIWYDAIVSAHIGPSMVGGIHILDGSIGGVDLADLAVVSAKIGTTEVGTPHLAALAVTEAKIGAGAVTSGKIGTGIIGDTLVKDYGIISGKVASGSITEQALVSGISIDISELSEEPGYRAGETISSFCCVFVAPISGNFVKIATALSGGMPAIGMTPAAIASGALGVINYGGRVAAPTAVVSGQQGRNVFVGSDGQLKITPPATSGYCQQIMGTVKDDDEIHLFPEPGYIELT